MRASLTGTLFQKHSTGAGITNPYGQTKHVNELILQDVCKADNTWNVVLLRYFNPVGAHKSGNLTTKLTFKPSSLRD